MRCALLLAAVLAGTLSRPVDADPPVADGSLPPAPEVFELPPEPPWIAAEPFPSVTCDVPCDGACDGGRGTLLIWNTGRNVQGGPALDEPLVTDRPDFTEASVTVGRGVTQIEFGYTYGYDTDGTTSTRSQSWGEPLVRHGILADWFELRLAVFPVEQRVATPGGAASERGVEDLYLGAKIALVPQDGWLPETALVPQMTVPTGSSAFTNDQVLPGANLIYSWEIDDFVSTAGSTQFNQAIDGGTGGTYTEWAQSWTVAYSLADDVGAYTEWFALVPASADTADTEHYFNGGFTYLVSDDVQWDVRAGVGLNDAAEDYFVGTGLSVRLRP